MVALEEEWSPWVFRARILWVAIMARRSTDPVENLLRLVFLLVAILIFTAGAVAVFKGAFVLLFPLGLVLVAGGLLCWIFLRALRGNPRDHRQRLEEYLRSRPYDPVPTRPRPSGPAPSTSAPRTEPGSRTADDVPPQRSVRPPDVDEIVAHLRALDWFQFESAMGVLFGHVGHRVRRTGGASPDGGIDLELTRGTDRIAVQCKHWQAGEVGVKVVREFMGAMVAAGITQGILIGSAGFSGPARELAAQQRIELLDERDVARRIQSAGGWWDPLFRSAFVSPPKLCPKCGSPLVERVAKRGPGIGKAFYGCSRYPRCTQTMPG